MQRDLIKVSWWTLYVGDPRNFRNSFFVKNYYLNLNFFQVLQSALLNNEINIFSKKMQAILKLIGIARDRRKTLKKEKEKRKMIKSQTTPINIFLLTFLFRKIYILLENVFRKTCFLLLRLYYSFFAWQSIGNVIIKYQPPYRYALVL